MQNIAHVRLIILHMVTALQPIAISPLFSQPTGCFCSNSSKEGPLSSLDLVYCKHDWPTLLHLLQHYECVVDETGFSAYAVSGKDCFWIMQIQSPTLLSRLMALCSIYACMFLTLMAPGVLQKCRWSIVSLASCFSWQKYSCFEGMKEKSQF